jgi:hypothetical protein
MTDRAYMKHEGEEGRGKTGPRGPRGPSANENLSYWRQKGVIPRWQMLLVYVLVIGAGAVGIARTETVASDAQELAEANKLRIMEVQESRDALCALRADLQKRLALARKFLRENPGGTPGIPERTIRDSIRNLRSTLEALDGLTCPR